MRGLGAVQPGSILQYRVKGSNKWFETAKRFPPPPSPLTPPDPPHPPSSPAPPALPPRPPNMPGVRYVASVSALQHALDAASSGEHILLEPDASPYLLTDSLVIRTNINISSAGSNRQRAVIDAQGIPHQPNSYGPIFKIPIEIQTLSLTSLILQNGFGHNGGVLDVLDFSPNGLATAPTGESPAPSSLIVRSCTLRRNEAYYGGAFLLLNGRYANPNYNPANPNPNPNPQILENCTFEGIRGIYFAGALFVQGLYEADNVQIRSCTFVNNTAPYGGAIELNMVTSNFIVEDTVFDGNVAGNDGGAVRYAAPYATSTNENPFAFVWCTFRGNLAAANGGLCRPCHICAPHTTLFVHMQISSPRPCD